MGFAASGATAVLFVGLLVCFGVLFPVVERTAERHADARDRRGEASLDRQNTAIAIESATYNATNETLELRVTNEGSTVLAVARTDLLVDGEYVAFEATVAGEDRETWLPGETLRVVAAVADDPDRVKVVTERGVADTVVGV